MKLRSTENRREIFFRLTKVSWKGNNNCVSQIFQSIHKPLFANGEVYHVFNRTEKGQKIFVSAKDCQRFIETVEFYLLANPPTRFSFYKKKPSLYKIISTDKSVTVFNHVLMPTHFHFTLRQENDEGILKFIRRISNSYAHYFNTKHDMRGGLFERNYKAIHVGTDEQLIHLSRYIHLNPSTAFLVEKPEDYPFSSYRAYLGLEKLNFLDTSFISRFFPNVKDYQKFVDDRIGYQRELKKIKDLLFDE